MRIDVLTRLVLTISLLSLLQWACNDPAAIDTELLNEDLVDVQFTNDFELQSTTVVEDSIRTYNVGTDLNRYLCGNFTDPIFGRTEANIYAQLVITENDPPFFANGPILDSVILSLAYAQPDGVYGDSTSSMYGLDVFRIAESLPNNEDLYSTQDFQVDGISIGDAQFLPRPSDSLDIFRYNEVNSTDDIDTVRSRPQIRIKLKNSFGATLMELDSSAYSNNDNFIEAFEGIYITSTTENEGILGFDLGSTQSRLTLYYRLEGKKYEYNYYFSPTRPKFIQYKHDYSGSVVEDFLDDPAMGDDLAFLQGMSGTNVRLDFPDIANVSDSKVVVNRAILEFYAIELSEDVLDLYEKPEQILVVKEGDTGFQLIEDLVGISTTTLFGGIVESTNGEPDKYTINISAHVQEMIDGDADNSIFLRIFSKPSDFSRVVLYGANDSQFPMKLNLTYTQLK